MKQEGTRKRRLRGNVTLLDEEKMEKNMNAENEKNTFPTSHKYQGLKGVKYLPAIHTSCTQLY